MDNRYFFYDDYSEGAHPRILDALVRTNLQQERGYGEDSFAREAERLIQHKIGQPKAKVYFVSSGTHANLICVSSLLKSYESVIAPDNGHANVYEAGAIEVTGHKINSVPGVDGKITSDGIRTVLASNTDEHTVKPRAVYISQATEFGTVYTKQELQDVHNTCQENDLYLYIDGARLGNAVMAKGADLDLPDIANLCDIFYIGGTKNGGLLGEAIVIVNPSLQEYFRHYLRQRGGLLAKARSVTVQFVELFKDNLYFENAQHANDLGQKLATGIRQCGYQFLNEPVANQIFPILPNTVIKKLQEKFGFYERSKIDTHHSAIRLVTSWATPVSAVDNFISELQQLSK